MHLLFHVCVCSCLCKMWKKLAHTSIQELRQMVFDMDSDVKAVGIDKRTSHEQDFKKLGFQVLRSMFICHFYT